MKILLVLAGALASNIKDADSGEPGSLAAINTDALIMQKQRMIISLENKRSKMVAQDINPDLKRINSHIDHINQLDFVLGKSLGIYQKIVLADMDLLDEFIKENTERIIQEFQKVPLINRDCAECEKLPEITGRLETGCIQARGAKQLVKHHGKHAQGCR